LNHPQTQAITIYCDNQRTIQLTNNPIFHARTKHIEIHHDDYVCEKTQKENIIFKYWRIEDQVANIFTKPLSIVKFVKFYIFTKPLSTEKFVNFRSMIELKKNPLNKVYVNPNKNYLEA